MNPEHRIRNAVDWLMVVLFLVAGVVFVTWPVGHLADAVEVGSWEEQECRIDSFRFDQPQPDVYWQLHVRYTYRYNGKGYASENLALDVMDYISKADAAPLTSALTPGAEHPCYVNPDNPEEAILFRPMGLEVFAWGFGFLTGWAFLVIGGLGLRRMIAVKATSGDSR